MCKSYYFFKRFYSAVWVLGILLLFIGCAARTHTLTGRDPSLRYSTYNKRTDKNIFLLQY